MNQTILRMSLAFAVSLGLGPSGQAQTPPVSTPPAANEAEMRAFIDDLLAQMTLEEKVGQLNQAPGAWNDTGPAVPEVGVDEIRKGAIGSFLSVYGSDVTREMQRIAVEESRLGIPLLFAHDVIHGFRTIFPVPLAEASSWDPEAAELSARIAAVEATAHGVHWTYAPMVDIARDPRWGRIVEGSGEDPYLGAVMAAARVRGFQGTELTALDTLLACAKHFAAYGAAEGGRDYNTVEISERALREVYFPPFQAAADAGVATFMASFNDIGGVPAHASSFLFNDVLRGEWGWNGLVVSDYTGIQELMDHGVAASLLDAGLQGIHGGVDIDMLSKAYLLLPHAIDDGRIDTQVIDAAVRRVLEAKWKLGLFEDPYRYSDMERQKALTLTPEHRAAAREVAQKSIVLLKNDRKVLPLSKDIASLAVIGPLADDAHSAIGNWAAAGRPEDAVTVLEGIRRALPDTEIHFTKGADVATEDTSGFVRAVEAARAADAVVLVLGEHRDMSAEAKSRTSLDLPGVQRELAEAVLETGKPVVVVLMNGRPLSIGWLDENIPAIVESWFLGVETGNAVADVLFGDVNPSGKLPITFPRTVGQVPIYYNHRQTGRPADATDMYTSKYIDAPWTPLYVFGHGLSYTEFDYDHLSVSSEKITPEQPITVEFDVRNTGDRAGVEVVQLYIQDVVGTTARPVRELRRFERVPLEPGETKRISFTLQPEDLACLSPQLEWRVEPGQFKVYVGGSSAAELNRSFSVEPATTASTQP
ncbi:MAG: glycoside hydrolase family 3 N-terminal domain-containing protein [Verrucomicrobiota bacterium JB022]|nr:glycoside hydrolase family 3 N-terminal domain-containing protein [Verrucomicrobiota bacterium JB022]